MFPTDSIHFRMIAFHVLRRTVFGLLVLGSSQASAQSSGKPALQSLRATVEVASGPIGGSGYVIDSAKGLIVTNAHVIPDDSITVFLSNARAALARKLILDTLADLAVIQVNPAFTRAIPQLRLRETLPEIGEPAFAMGFPLRRRITATSGMVASIDNDAVFVDALLNPGNSGGPIVDQSGSVIGTATFVLQDPTLGPGLGAAISNAKLLPLVRRAEELAASDGLTDTLPPVSPHPTWRLGWDEVKESVLRQGTVWYAGWDDLRAGPFDIVPTTPGSNWAALYGQDSVLSMERIRRDRKSGSPMERYSAIAALRNWDQYVGDQLLPVVAIQVNPRPSAKLSSIVGNLVLSTVIGITGPLSYAFGGDVLGARLLRDGAPVRKISGGHAPQRFWIESRWVTLKDVADFGHYVFPAEAFSPRTNNTLPDIVIEVTDRKTTKVHKLRLPDVVIARIWADFSASIRARYPERSFADVRLHRSCKEVPGFADECRDFVYIDPIPESPIR
jgi:hypothetical protein